MTNTMKPASELTDAELNRAMIWLYFKGKSLEYAEGINGYLAYMYAGGTARQVWLNYLEDWNVLMPLALENGIDILNQFDGQTLAAEVDHYTHTEEPIYGKWVECDKPQRAICECLYEIKRLEK